MSTTRRLKQIIYQNNDVFQQLFSGIHLQTAFTLVRWADIESRGCTLKTSRVHHAWTKEWIISMSNLYAASAPWTVKFRNMHTHGKKRQLFRYSEPSKTVVPGCGLSLSYRLDCTSLASGRGNNGLGTMKPIVDMLPIVKPQSDSRTTIWNVTNRTKANFLSLLKAYHIKEPNLVSLGTTD